MQQCCCPRKPKKDNAKQFKEKLIRVIFGDKSNNKQTTKIMVDGQWLTYEECSKKFNMNFNNHVMIDMGVLNEIPFKLPQRSLNASDPKIKEEVNAYFARAESLIGIRTALEQQLGYEAYAMSDIKKGKLVAIYLGRYTPRTVKDINTDQIVDLINSKSLYTFRIDDNYVIDAGQYGNEARFIQHLPKADDVPESIRHNIAIENLRPVLIGGTLPFVYFYASTDIKAGALLGFNYGLDYWEKQNKEPILFQAGTSTQIDPKLQSHIKDWRMQQKIDSMQQKKYV